MRIFLRDSIFLILILSQEGDKLKIIPSYTW